ncbi:MAG: three-Cys-motif partner protein TcmP [Phycisphaerae bacterium]
MNAEDCTNPAFGSGWTEKKLNILAAYLSKYNTVLKKQSFTRVYLDAFAGTGYRKKREREFAVRGIFADIEEEEPQRFLKGSAKRSLEVEPPFHKYIFVESDPAKVRALTRLKQEHKSKAGAITIVKDDANKFVRKYCRAENWRTTRAVVFLDPFATEVAWTTIKAVASTRAIDVWILFPLMAINRLLAKDPQKACWDRLTDVFGTEEWFERFYSTSRRNTIFGKPLKVIRKRCNFRQIGEFYRERLQAIFAGVCQKPTVFRNSRRSPLFQLFFAAGNARGAPIALRIADHLLRNI